jgi:hypothetical protein
MAETLRKIALVNVGWRHSRSVMRSGFRGLRRTRIHALRSDMRLWKIRRPCKQRSVTEMKRRITRKVRNVFPEVWGIVLKNAGLEPWLDKRSRIFIELASDLDTAIRNLSISRTYA